MAKTTANLLMAALLLVVIAGISGAERACAGESKAAPGGEANADWPRFLGSSGEGQSPLKGIRKDWTGGLKKVWEVKGLCPETCAWSPPSIQGNKLVVMGQRANPAGQKGSTDVVFCFDADKGGEPLWKQEFQDDYSDYGWGTGPTSAPTMDGDTVFVVNRCGTLFCLNMADGKTLWKAQAGGACHGYNASPLVWDDLLIVPGLMYKPWHYALLGAVKKSTGEQVWTYREVIGGGQDGGPSKYGSVSPVRMQLNGKDQIVYSSGTLVCGMDARSGKPLWEQEIAKGWGGNYTPCGPVVVWPFFYVTTSDCKPAIGLQMDGAAPKEVWRGFSGNKAKCSPSLARAMALNEYIYTFTTRTDYYFGASFGGWLVCIDPKTGQVKWEENTGNGSMIAVDGCLLCLTYTGDLFLVNPSPEKFNKITEWKGAIPRHPWLYKGKEWKKDPAPCWVGPVVARGKLYLRYDDILTCYDLMK